MLFLPQPSVRQSSRIIRESVLPHWQNCVYCNKKVSSQMTLDHIIPKAAQEEFEMFLPDGINSVENLVIACRECNNARGHMPLPEWLLKYKPEARIYLLDFFRTLEGIMLKGVDYIKGIKKNMLLVFDAGKANPQTKELNIDELIKNLGLVS